MYTFINISQANTPFTSIKTHTLQTHTFLYTLCHVNTFITILFEFITLLFELIKLLFESCTEQKKLLKIGNSAWHCLAS